MSKAVEAEVVVSPDSEQGDANVTGERQKGRGKPTALLSSYQWGG